MDRIQILAILASLGFLLYIARLIVKGKLREEYAIIWIVCTLVLVVFSVWRDGLEVFSQMLGIYEAPNMVFTGAIFAIMIYLLHLSIVLSKVQSQNKKLTQELTLLKEKLENKERKN
jgi:hypothetical protein